jgi:SAM-dependent methyltransferase
MIPNSSRKRLLWENERFAKTVAAASLVLDAGCGESPYQSLFSHARYESADFTKADRAYAAPTYVCDLSAIPVEDERYDAVLFNQVMEHLPEPAKVLAELYRVMKPGARLIYTAPFFFEPHEEPYDFYRYTRHGARHLIEAAGFQIERMDWMEGYFGTAAYQLHKMAEHLPLRPSSISPGMAGVLLSPVMLGAKSLALTGCLLFHWLETRHKFTLGGYPKNYVAIVTKPEKDKRRL